MKVKKIFRGSSLKTLTEVPIGEIMPSSQVKISKKDIEVQPDLTNREQRLIDKLKEAKLKVKQLTQDKEAAQARIQELELQIPPPQNTLAIHKTAIALHIEPQVKEVQEMDIQTSFDQFYVQQEEPEIEVIDSD